jgi:hypothetical protein
MERNALVAVFPAIWLLICKFHLRQSWRNHCNHVLKGNSPIYIEVKHHLARIEDMLIHTTTIEDARAIIMKEAEVLEAMAENGHASVAAKGLQHLNDYLLGYWTTDTLWKSWSDYGRRTAARVLKCPIEGVLPTTNHLESFNGLLKWKHLKRWQRGGKRLRIDVLLRLLITKVLPSIFEQRAMQRAEDLRWAALVRQLPGGDALLLETKSLTVSIIPTTAYLTSDPEREAAVVTLLANNQISHPTFESHDKLTFACHSSISTIYEPSPTEYQVILCLDGTARCTCKDFSQRGGACKHIRAALLRVDECRASGLLESTLHIPVPLSAKDAIVLQNTETSHAFQLPPAPPASVNTAKLPTIVIPPIQRAAAAVDDALRDDMLAEVDNDETQPDSNEPHPESDDEDSVDTDASNEDGDGDEFDFSALEGTAKVGIDEQTIARTFYELEQAAPKLAQLGIYLKATQIRKQQDAQRAVKLRSELDQLSGALTRLIENFNCMELDYEPASATPMPLTIQPTTPDSQVQLMGAQLLSKSRVTRDISTPPFSNTIMQLPSHSTTTQPHVVPSLHLDPFQFIPPSSQRGEIQPDPSFTIRVPPSTSSITTTDAQRKRRRTVTTILNASPEKSQKRKNSYAPH